ncbi:MAG: serine hydrolase [bacterium]|nr:serine hydrolase [bacterium]
MRHLQDIFNDMWKEAKAAGNVVGIFSSSKDTSVQKENSVAPVAHTTPESHKIEVGSFVKKPEYFFWSALILALVLLAQGERPETASAVPEVSVNEEAPAVNPFEHLALEARAAFVYDAKTKETLYAKNAEEELPLASLTKIMTAATALTLLPEDTQIRIDSEDLSTEGDTRLRPGEVWKLRDLLQFLLIESSNDGAQAVSTRAGMIASGIPDREAGRIFFIARMNTLGKELGLTSTFFRNETGLDQSASAVGAMSNAREAAHMLAATLSRFPGVFRATKWSDLLLSSEDGTSRRAHNTNKSADRFPLLLASKTGYTDLAGGNLVVAFDAGFGHPIVIAVMGSTLEGRFTDAEKLVWATLASLQQKQ